MIDNCAYDPLRLIGYEDYFNILFDEILKDYPSREEYMTEIILPFLRRCCPEGAKLIPIYADRNVGRKKINDRMKTICAPDSNDGYVVPDYIYVPSDYSYSNPVKPLVMVELKKPDFEYDDSGKLVSYRDVLDYLNGHKNMQEEVRTEIKACKIVILTDGLTWAFLELKGGKIVESKKYPTIHLLNVYDKEYVNPKTRRTHKKYYCVKGSSIIGCKLKYDADSTDFSGWDKLENQISNLVLNTMKK